MQSEKGGIELDRWGEMEDVEEMRKEKLSPEYIVWKYLYFQ